MPETFVYVMSCYGRTKIGISTDPSKRKRQLQNASGLSVALRTSRVFPNRATAAAVEETLHRRYGRSRGLGEWFETDPHAVCMALRDLHVDPVEEDEPIIL